MTKLLLRWYENRKRDQPPSRESYGAFAGLVGMLCNLLLFAGKLLVGILAGSVSVIADAVNNLSDAASSVVTLVGFRMSRRPADKEHPYGHARIEYMAGAFIGVVIILVGAELLRSSFDKMLHPTPVDFSPLTLGLLVAAVLVKLWMRAFYRSVGRRIDSPALGMAAQDSRNDVITTTVVLIGAAVEYFFGIALDGVLGVGVALFILISGILSMRDTLSPLLGEAPDQSLVDALSRDILGYQGVLGIHDLLVHSYGPGRTFATVHVEMSSDTDPLISHGIIDHIERELGERYHLSLVVHYDPVETHNAQIDQLREEVERIVQEIDPALSIHDLRIAKTYSHTNVIFDVAVPPQDGRSSVGLKQQIDQRVRALDPRYHPVIQMDRNYTEYDPEQK